MKADIKVRNGKQYIRCGLFELCEESLSEVDGYGHDVVIATNEDLDALYTILRTRFILKEKDKVSNES